MREHLVLRAVFEACRDLKGEGIQVLDLSSVESYTDYIVVVSATNERQVQALSDRVVEAVFQEAQVHPLGVEGYDAAQWVLIDLADVVCHVFLQEVRDLYQIENLWPGVVPLTEEQVKDEFAAA